MSEPKHFGRRRRGGMRFRPSGGPKPSKGQERDAQQARADAVGEKSPLDPEAIYERSRYQKEIDRAENVAAGLPPEGVPEAQATGAGADGEHRHEFREPHLDTPAEVTEETYTPVTVEQKPKTLLEAIKATAAKVIKKVQRLIRPVKKTHKEVIINAEALETRVAVSEEGRLEEFTIERTNEERLVGSIFKGKVRNLEDGLKAAFVDIGFEKNAFLHYWDIVPSNFDSGVEVVEREGGRKRDRPKITQKDIPRLYPPGSDIIVQVTKGPIGTKGPRVTTNLVLPGRYSELRLPAVQSLRTLNCVLSQASMAITTKNSTTNRIA